MSCKEACRLCCRSLASACGIAVKLKMVGYMCCEWWMERSGCCNRYTGRKEVCEHAAVRRGRRSGPVVRCLQWNSVSRSCPTRQMRRGKARARAGARAKNLQLTGNDADLEVALDTRHLEILGAQNLLKLCIQKCLRLGNHAPRKVRLRLCLSITACR